ncbi:protein containing Peroxiredoxin, OsmC-like protein domain [Pseudovibrio sp. FO-BEG1]|uniref:Uncharacterized OsmC-related protein n=2 Tax=Pseudovibrio denitrificans TaxID=258256 RepID=A0A1I7DXU3_9HYPH|nr:MULTISPECIES: OsmC family protein [Pseudovibrio]AEV39488.1 protein containing Peroxiredoxin, OsmC-like protein domain [Pseudovibrio sp. FO-BEG1]SFU16455.1 Uncharacterized OsmC-related protein [Pseudovibrio denitrificans]
MPIRMKPKSYGPLTVASHEYGQFWVTNEFGHQYSAGLGDSDEFSAPSDLIMSALGSCMAISLEMVAKQQKVALGNVYITVNAEKASTLPHRFGSFHLEFALPEFEDREKAEAMLKAAKEICTVSNTLNAEISFSLV